MATCLKLAMLLVVAQTALGCKYFCKNPETREYVCCDGGNPFTEKTTVEPVTNPPGESTNCFYYCGWEDTSYCCHEASSPISPPRDHSAHKGSCPKPDTMICMDSQDYNLIKDKTASIFLKNGSVVVPQSDDRYDVCASDGYCLEDEKCCANPCVQRHTCVKALPSEDDPEDPEEGPEDGTKGESSGCYYNCVYGEQIYCCHEAGSPLNPDIDHNEHTGECPDEDEMLCLNPQEYDLIKDDPTKVILANGTVFASEPRDRYDVCASDGYCQDYEKCCANPCAKRHTCVMSLKDDKSLLEKEAFVKKKASKYPGVLGKKSE